MSAIHERTELLVGSEGLDRLSRKHVLIAGLGGVGSYAAEAIARAGVGRVTLIDHDVIDASNLNRQLVALHSTLGQRVSDAMAARVRDINPDIDVRTIGTFLCPANVDDVIPAELDYALDCIDSIAGKAVLVASCQERGIPVASSMGAGGRLDPTALRTGPLEHSTLCPLARELRKRLRRMGASLDYPVVYSIEKPLKGTEHRPFNGSRPGRSRTVNGTISYLPPLFGYMLAGLVIRGLLAEANAGRVRPARLRSA
ncbi:tRNA threonylcarbamoyladenosine dehydratase [Thioalkalivibrio denitrificans]|uniref:tRNA threonylcarbamoyladenosine dehydratase n=1 Tax=Thioalkalivibrio denitrificans TaxID=108003 RepID=A0A1V3NEG2_9GAMM|nr:tRNA threonylcarbamoyladenosine dehydratase [Thioalkalivibrio denitrificans]OOG23186.1 tRNA threonylcarbamoyladenosine dehydratase [Thioalkalivibrio denitrificans]